MPTIRTLVPALCLSLGALACAPAATRAPVTDIPAGTYVLVEPEPDGFYAVTINERAFAVRMDDMTHTGEHWIDAEGRLHMADIGGPCAGQESIWTYSFANNRVSMDLVEDRCAARPMSFPQRWVWERS